MAKNVSVVLAAAKSKLGCRKIKEPYKPSPALMQRISAEDREKTKKLLAVVHEELVTKIFDVNIYTNNLLNIAAPAIGEINFDIDAGTRGMMKVVDESGIRFGINRFLKVIF